MSVLSLPLSCKMGASAPHLVMDGCLLGCTINLFSVRAQPPIGNVVVDRVIEEHHILGHLYSMRSILSGALKVCLQPHRGLADGEHSELRGFDSTCQSLKFVMCGAGR